MLLKYLDAKHATYDADSWLDNQALYAGGKKFRDRVHRFLPQNPMEPDQVYAQRKTESKYKPYIGSIIDYYVAWLFSANFDIRTKDTASGKETELDSFYSNWKEEVSDEKDLKDFMRCRMTDALTDGCAYWRVDFPDDGGARDTDRADFKSRGLGQAKLREIPRCEVYDWECDDNGALLWAIVHDLKSVRADPRLGARDTFIEMWCLYDAVSVETFQVKYQKGKRPRPTEEIASVGKRAHGLGRVPIVVMTPPEGLSMVERLKDAQIENFSVGAALNWNIKRTCYAMPVFKVANDEKPPRMGAGYYIMLGMGESCEWIGPPTEHLKITSETVEATREELYRLTHQLALSVNNRKAAAVGRSGESKEQDSLSTRVILNALGAVAKEAIEETFEMLSDGNGDTDITFSIEGLDAFDTEAVSALMANATAANGLGLFGLSKTWDKELRARAMLGMVPDIDQSRKDAIRQEVNESVDNPPTPPDDEASLHAMADRIASRATQQNGARRAGGAKPSVAQKSGGDGTPAVAEPAKAG